MKLEIDLTKGIKEDHENGGYLIPIKTPFTVGDCYGDLISADVESQSLWFDSRIISIIEAGWHCEEYRELEDWLTEVFKGSRIGASILGCIRNAYYKGLIS